MSEVSDFTNSYKDSFKHDSGSIKSISAINNKVKNSTLKPTAVKPSIQNTTKGRFYESFKKNNSIEKDSQNFTNRGKI